MEWDALIRGLARHESVVRRRRWRLPARTRTALVPLVRVLTEDMRPDGVLSVALDLRGPKFPEKTGPRHEMPVQRPVTSMKQWFVVDPWLRLRAELRDGSVLELAVTDRIRYRRIRKRNPRGKIKVKYKTKKVLRVDATRRLAKAAAVRRPASPPPGWIVVRVKDGPRPVIRATAKIPAAADERALVEPILTVSTELFRWTPPGTGAQRRTA